MCLLLDFIGYKNYLDQILSLEVLYYYYGIKMSII